MYTDVTTKYPLLLVHGLFGFNRIGQYEMFQNVVPALEKAGCRVHVPALPGVHDNEERGELLLLQIERFLKRTGYLKVNLIGHSQGALACRYAAAVRPDRVASVTSISGPHHGSEVADRVCLALTPGAMDEQTAERTITAFQQVLGLLSGDPAPPPIPVRALQALTSERVAEFNRAYPQALPGEWGGEGSERVKGVHYYSWSGCIARSPRGDEQKPLAPLLHALQGLTLFFERETVFNDGFVGRYSSHLGKVIRCDYPMDHIEGICSTPVGIGAPFDPVKLYVDHAGLLFRKGL